MTWGESIRGGLTGGAVLAGVLIIGPYFVGDTGPEATYSVGSGDTPEELAEACTSTEEDKQLLLRGVIRGLISRGYVLQIGEAFPVSDYANGADVDCPKSKTPAEP